MQSNNWKKIRFNLQNIVVKTAKSVLISMPNSSHYSGFKFWHPSKLVREEGGRGYWMSFSYTIDFEFILRRYNRSGDVTKKICIDCVEMEEAFKVVNEDLKERIGSDESYLEVVEPTKINEIVEVREELKK